MGVLLYMFIVGLELNPAVLRGRTSVTVTVSHGIRAVLRRRSVGDRVSGARADLE
jgi:hypothetical protein